MTTLIEKLDGSWECETNYILMINAHRVYQHERLQAN